MDKDALFALREKINALDVELLELLQKRAYISKQVGKAKQGGSIFYPVREKEIIAHLQKLNNTLQATEETGEEKQKLPSESIVHIWTEIFSCSRLLQKETSMAFFWTFWDFFPVCRRRAYGKKYSSCAMF